MEGRWVGGVCGDVHGRSTHLPSRITVHQVHNLANGWESAVGSSWHVRAAYRSSCSARQARFPAAALAACQLIVAAPPRSTPSYPPPCPAGIWAVPTSTAHSAARTSCAGAVSSGVPCPAAVLQRGCQLYAGPGCGRTTTCQAVVTSHAPATTPPMPALSLLILPPSPYASNPQVPQGVYVQISLW